MHTRIRSLAIVLAATFVIAPPLAGPTAAFSSVVMYIDGARGDGLTEGAQRVMGLGGIAISDGPTTFLIGTASEGPDSNWQLELHAPGGETFQAGVTYPGTDGAMLLSSSEFGSCGIGQEGSWFTVHALGAPFAVTFAFRCDGASESIFGYFGTFDSTTPVAALLQPEDAVGLPATAVGHTSTSVDVHVSSEGTVAANVSSVELAGPGADNFVIEDETCTGAPIDVGTTCSVSVAFAPELSGELRAELVLEDDTVRGSRSITVAGTGTAPASAVDWGSRSNVGANYTWSFGSNLARTVSPSTTYLHNGATTNRVNGKWADNNGPYLGVMYTRGKSSGTSWGTPFRVNPSSQHGDQAAIAAAGKYVYVTWVRLGKYQNYNPAAARTLYFRRNTSLGASGSWKSRVALTSTSGRVDVPSIAASGSSVYVAWTDSDTGSIRLAISDDRGATWTKRTVGSTSNTTTEGFYGLPSVAAAGSNVIVSWIGDEDLAVIARTSTDGGASWDVATTLASAATSSPASAARGSRLGVAWTAAAGARLRRWSGGSWDPVRLAGAPYGGRSYTEHRQPTLAFGAAGQIGIAWTACWANCLQFGTTTREDLVWVESNDDGSTWYRAQIIGNGDTATYRIHDAPSVVWSSASRRSIAWNGYQAGGPYYRMLIRTGTGTN